MSRFIDDKTIFAIIIDRIDDFKEIIETTMNISPFGCPGKRTYIVSYKNKNDELKHEKIDDQTYQTVYKQYN